MAISLPAIAPPLKYSINRANAKACAQTAAKWFLFIFPGYESGRPTTSEETTMSKQENRVLGRKGARIVTASEANIVNSGIMTETGCSIGPQGLDGDLFTGDCIAK
jgi:hypothetical protein